MLRGKILLSPDPEVHNPELGMQWLESAARNRNGYAAYRLGKEYLKGKIVPKDTTKAIDYFTQSAETGNQYAQGAGPLLVHPVSRPRQPLRSILPGPLG